MRALLLSASVVLVACGGNVVFVADGEDASGSGGASTSGPISVGQGGAAVTVVTVGDASSSIATTSSSSSGVFCQNDECMIGQTVCACDGECSICNDVECFVFTTHTKCNWIEDGAKCDCILDGGTDPGGTIVGTCVQGDLDCDTTSGCCGPIFQAAVQNP
jgi:hypothetical protein